MRVLLMLVITGMAGCGAELDGRGIEPCDAVGEPCHPTCDDLGEDCRPPADAEAAAEWASWLAPCSTPATERAENGVAWVCAGWTATYDGLGGWTIETDTLRATCPAIGPAAHRWVSRSPSCYE